MYRDVPRGDSDLGATFWALISLTFIRTENFLNGIPTRRIDVITVDFACSEGLTSVEKMLNWDWKRVEEAAASFSALRGVAISFKFLYEVTSFAANIEPKMPRLSRSGKLRYAVPAFKRYDRHDTWIACTPQSTEEGQSLVIMKMYFPLSRS